MPTADPPEPMLLSAPQVAALLGMHRATLWRLHSSGKLGPLPVRTLGRPRWRRAEIESWVRAGCPPRARWSWPDGREGKL